MMNTRRFLSAALLCCISVLAAAQTPETIPASDSRITYIGRTLTDGQTVSFDWTGVYMRVRFQGASLSLKASDTKKNYYNVWIDGESSDPNAVMAREPDKIISIAGKDTTIVIFSESEMKEAFGKKAAASPHQVTLQKRTEGEQGTTTLVSFTTDGSFLQADAPKARVIEYVGDSYTCGYGSENSVKTDPFKPETENQNKTYACIAARYFDAEQIVVAHSGMGIARNYNGNLNDRFMPDLYLRTFDQEKEPEWNADGCVKPSITVIYLGTNDFSTGSQPARKRFVANYIRLMQEIKANYGEDYPILCVAPKNDLGMFDYIREAFLTCGLSNVHIMALTTEVHDADGDLGASYHPNYKGHTKKAFAIIPYISTITGWEMSGKEIK